MTATYRSICAYGVLALALVLTSLCAACKQSAENKAAPAANAAPPAFTAQALTPVTANGQTATIHLPDPQSLTAASFKVEGMTCVDCTAAITQSLSKIDGVQSVSADWKKGAVNVNYEPGKVKVEQLSSAIEALKYKVTSCEGAGCPAGGAAANCPALAGAAGVADPASYVVTSAKLPNGHMQATYHLAGMMCTDCEQKVLTALKTVKGVDKVQATWKDGTAVVSYDPAQATPATLLAGLRTAGFAVQTADGKSSVPGIGSGCPAGQGCADCKDKGGCKDGCCKGKAGKGAAKTGEKAPESKDKTSHA
jgi:copper chaperone